MSTWAITGDPRHLAYENACALHGILTDALNDLQATPNVNLDDLVFVLDSQSDVVLGERGYRLNDGRLAFTGTELLNMAEMLGALLPALAADAHIANAQWDARSRRN